MTEFPRVQLVPDAFLIYFEPRNRSDRTPRPVPPLRFSRRLATVEYDVTLYYDLPTMLTVSTDGQRFLLVVGDVYRPQTADAGQALLDLYQRRGVDFVRDVNGLFAAVVIDRETGDILLVTDRRKSRNIFVRWDGGALIASNSIYLQRADERTLDRTAVAEYLVVGHTYNDRTILEGVETLAFASIYRLHEGRLNRNTYWIFSYSDEGEPVSLETLKRDLGDLLVEAVRLRLRSDSAPYLSLSGGYDSRLIVGILSKYLHVIDARIFSYAHGALRPNSDEDLARRIAGLCRYEHQRIESFGGDPIGVLRLNGQWGGGLSQTCDEVDAWVRLGAQVEVGPMPVLFTGDTSMYRSNVDIKSERAALDSTGLDDFSVLTWLEPLMDRSVYADWVSATRADLDRALLRVAPTADFYALRDAATAEQYSWRYINHWRENFAGRFFRVTAPLLDDGVLDFLLRVPSSLRRGKHLYMETARAMFPELFRLPRATSASYDSYWPDAIRQHNTALRAFVTERASPLDALISPDILLMLLEADLSPRGTSALFAQPMMKSAYRRVQRNRLVRMGLSRLKLTSSGVPTQKFLLRALTLRATVAELFG